VAGENYKTKIARIVQTIPDGYLVVYECGIMERVEADRVICRSPNYLEVRQ